MENVYRLKTAGLVFDLFSAGLGGMTGREQTDFDMHIIIAGGGIGGLTTALCCAHFGHHVTVLERAAALTDVGAGIQIPPNAMKVFQALGLDADIARDAFAPTALETRMGETGQQIFRVPLGALAVQRWGAPYLHIHRADYITALAEALSHRAPDALRLGASVLGYTQGDDGVAVSLDTGDTLTGDILIGADGIGSVVQSQMLGPQPATFTGNVAWRLTVPVSDLGKTVPPPTACAWMGRGRHGVTYLLRRGTVANFVGVVERRDWQEEGWTLRGSRAEALDDFKGWDPIITRLIETAPEDSLHRWALFDRAPLPHWTDGRVALLGDASHPMLPFMAQGAAMAVEDAWVLAQEISHETRDVAASLLAYQSRRHARTAKVQAASRANMSTFHQRTRLGQLATYGPMWLGGRLAPNVVRGRFDWLYETDVTQD
mgnify:CR=1 FL=1